MYLFVYLFVAVPINCFFVVGVLAIRVEFWKLPYTPK